MGLFGLLLFAISGNAAAQGTATDEGLFASRLALVAIVALFALAGYLVARRQGRKKASRWGMAGLIFGPFAIAYMLMTNDVSAGNAEPVSQRVQFFLDLGLLEKRGRTTEAIAQEISQRFLEEYGESNELDRGDVHSDLLLFQFGDGNLWWEDTEADVLKGNNVYVDTLRRWAALTRGVFSPSSIVETWETDEGPIRITFDLSGKQRSASPKYIEDYIDTDLLKQLNRMLPDSGPRFELVAPFDQTAAVLWLDETSKRALERRGWKFSW